MALTPKIFMDVADDTSRILDEMQSHMNIVDNSVEEIRNNWKDDNGRKFVEEYELLKKDFPALYAQIAEMVRNMKIAHKAYMEVYELNAKAVNTSEVA